MGRTVDSCYIVVMKHLLSAFALFALLGACANEGPPGTSSPLLDSGIRGNGGGGGGGESVVGKGEGNAGQLNRVTVPGRGY